MKYVMLILDTPEEPKADTPEYGAWYAEVSAWYEKWGASGQLADGGAALQPPSTAKTVRASGVTDGPFMETKEVVGGFSVLEAGTIDEAIEIARTWPGVDKGWIAVEVRPVMDMS